MKVIFKKFQNLNSKGLGILEMMIVVGITGIAIMASLSLQTGRLKVQRQGAITQTVQAEVVRLQNLVLDTNSWNRTLAENAGGPMGCLLNNGDCWGYRGVKRAFNLWDGVPGSTSPVWPPNGYTNPGMTETGTRCSGYVNVGGAANRQCPISFRLTWEPMCNGINPCINPAVEVEVNVVYNNVADAPVLNAAKYSKTLIRGARNLQKSFALKDRSGGNCPAGGAVARNLVNTHDPFGLVRDPNVGAAPVSTFTIEQVGTYNCTVSASGHQVGNFQSRMVASPGGALIASGVGYAPANTQASATFDTVLVVNTPGQAFRLTQDCQNGFGTGLGILFGTTPETASIVCTKNE